MKATIECGVVITVEAAVEGHERLDNIKEEARKIAQAAINDACKAINESDRVEHKNVRLSSGYTSVKMLKEIE